MKISKKEFLLVFCLLWLSSAYSKELLKTTSTWEGGEISYPEGKPEIASIMLKIDEGKVMPFHCHPVPTMGYVIKGNLEVETRGGKKIILREGESALEVLRTVHRGMPVDGPVEIVVFYAGTTTLPNTVLPENDPEHTYCNK